VRDDYPTTPGAWDDSYEGPDGTGYVTKLDPDGSSLGYSTRLTGVGVKNSVPRLSDAAI